MPLDETFSDVVDTLVNGDPSYSELVCIYQTLQEKDSSDVETAVAEHALSTVIRDMIDYLDFVGAELEKSVGITRADELERILDALEMPEGSSSIEQMYDFLQQWESVDLYTFEDAYPSEMVDTRESLEQRV